MTRHNRFPRAFAFRLEEDVANRLRDVAHAHGYRPAEWARKIVSEAIAEDFVRRAVRLRVQNAELLSAYLEELARQGSNINQIARHLNANDQRRAESSLQELDAIRQQNQRIMMAVLDALGANETP